MINISTHAKKKTTKYKKILLSSLLVIILLLASNIGLYFYITHYMTTAKTFEYNWKITLPSNLKEEYYIDTGSSFQGDGKRYSIFSGNSFLTSLNAKRNQDLEEEIKKMYNSLKIPKKYQVNFQHDYAWKKMDNEEDKRSYLYCIFDKNKNKFYFYENIY